MYDFMIYFLKKGEPAGKFKIKIKT